MAILFFDASAVVKRYIHEPGSVWIRDLCEARDENRDKVNVVGIAGISRVEVAAAFAILVRRSQISKFLAARAFDQFSDEVEEEYQLLHLSPEIIRNAAELTQGHPLKAYDAVQLATALAFYESLKADGANLIFVSGDTKLLQAAQAEGLVAEDPHAHAHQDDMPQ